MDQQCRECSCPAHRFTQHNIVHCVSYSVIFWIFIDVVDYTSSRSPDLNQRPLSTSPTSAENRETIDWASNCKQHGVVAKHATYLYNRKSEFCGLLYRHPFTNRGEICRSRLNVWRALSVDIFLDSCVVSPLSALRRKFGQNLKFLGFHALLTPLRRSTRNLACNLLSRCYYAKYRMDRYRM